MEYTLAVFVLIWVNCLHVCDCSLAVSNEDGTTKTTKYVCKGENTVDFIWTYDDTDSDKDFIAEIKWSREISGGTAELIMTYATGAGTLNVETAWNGRVTRVTSPTNSIGMQLSNPVNGDEAEYYVTLFVIKPTPGDEYTVAYKDQSITLDVVDIVAAWWFTSTNGGTDLSTYAENDVYIDPLTYRIGPNGETDGAVEFRDVDIDGFLGGGRFDVVSITDKLVFTASMTFFCHVYIPAGSDKDTALFAYKGSSLPALLVDLDTGSVQVQNSGIDPSTGNPYIDLTDLLQQKLDQWLQLAVVYDASYGVKIYESGILLSQTPCNVDLSLLQTGTPLIFGGKDEITQTMTGGALACAQFYNTALTQAEVQALTCDIVHGGWSDWSDWDITCPIGGGATRTRSRLCNNPTPIFGGKDCNGTLFEVQSETCPSETTGHQPELHSVWPDFGPQSGGTNITIRGQYLPRYGQLIVYVGPKECTTVNLNATFIIARTLGLGADESHLLDENLSVYVRADNIITLTSKAVFTYKTDPVIDSVYPKESIVPGGTLLTVRGSNFYSVADIKMETTMILKKLITSEPPDYHEERTLYVTNCEVLNEAQMKCVTANISLPDVFTNPSAETKRKRNLNKVPFALVLNTNTRRKRQETPQWVTTSGDYTLEVYIGFRLDGVNKHKNFSFIEIHAEPKFNESGLKKRFKKGELISFEGNHLDRGVTVYDYNITIGSGTCTAIELLSNILSCLPPQTRPGNATVSDQEIFIHIGLNVDHFAGHLIYPDEQMPLYVWVLIGVLPALVIIVIIITIVVCVKKRQTSTP